MTSFPLDLLEHCSLTVATDCDLHNDIGMVTNLLGFDSNLFCEFSCRGNDDGFDIGRAGSRVSFSLRKLWVLVEDILDSRHEESKRFTGTGSCLSDAAEGLAVVVNAPVVEW